MDPLYFEVSLRTFPTGETVYYFTGEICGEDCENGTHLPVLELEPNQAMVLSIFTPGHPFCLSSSLQHTEKEIEDEKKREIEDEKKREIEDEKKREIEDEKRKGIEDGIITVTHDQVKPHGRIYYKSTASPAMGNLIIAK